MAAIKSSTPNNNTLCKGCKKSEKWFSFDYCKNCIVLYENDTNPTHKLCEDPDDDFFEFQGPQCKADERHMIKILKEKNLI